MKNIAVFVGTVVARAVFVGTVFVAGFLLLAGCGADTSPKQPEPEREMAVADELPTDKGMPSSTERAPIRLDAAGEESATYEDLLNGLCPAVVDERFHGDDFFLKADMSGEFYLTELIQSCFTEETDAGSDIVQEIRLSYALADIGEDSRQELFVKGKSTAWANYWIVMAFYFDGGLPHLSFLEDEGERNSLILTKDGYVENLGSSSGTSFCGQTGRMMLDGNYQAWYKIEAGTGWGVQSVWHQPSLQDAYWQLFEGAEDDPAMELYIYTVDEQTYYEYFIWDDATDAERETCEKYFEMCGDLAGIRFTEHEDLELILSKKKEEVGITEKMTNTPDELEWVELFQ